MIVEAVGWALVQFLWQGTLVALATAIALALLRQSAADVRYVVATTALCFMVTMPVLTTTQLVRSESSTSSFQGPTPNAPRPTPREIPLERPRASWESGAGSWTLTTPQGSTTLPDASIPARGWLPLVVLAWCCGVALLTVRLLTAWVWIERIKSHGTSPVDDALQHAMSRLARRLHLSRQVRILQSALVDVPTVIGWLKPAVLLPVSTLAGLAPHQVEAILAHELAHVRRHDYLVNLLQTAVETLLFYHPAVWWLSRRIRAERENCCDDLAVSLCGDRFTYAKALADLEELRGAGGHLVMAATGGSLVRRIRRIVASPGHAGRAPGWLAGAAAVTLMLAVASAASIGDPFSQVVVNVTSDSQFPPPVPPAPPAPPVPPAPPALPPDVADAPMVPPLPPAAVLPPVPPVPAVPPSPPAQPLADLPPVPPAPPAPPQKRSGNFSWSNDGDRLQVQYEGEFEFTDDDTDIKRMEPGGFLRIKEGGWFSGRSVELRADANGTISRRFWTVNIEKPFEPEGRQWLSQVLPRFVRQSGLGARARVQRILKAKGPAGVLAEISLIEGGWAKRVYFAELLKTPLDPATVRQALVQAGREIVGDYELATLLIAASDTLIVDDATRAAYFDAARTIQSDYEMRRVYTSALRRGPVSPAVMAGILNVARTIGSDYEQASLLLQVARLQPLDGPVRAPFFAALDTIASDYERGRVLKAVAEREALSPEALLNVLRAVRGIKGDYETAQVLLAIAAKHPLAGASRDEYIQAAERLGSHEQGRVLTALVSNERRATK